MIAFCLWAEGFSESEALRDLENTPPRRWQIVAGQYKVDRREIPGYFTADFWHNLNIWDRCREYGLPFGGGWGAHPAPLMKLLQLFDAARAKVEKQKAEETQSHGNSGRAKTYPHGRV